MARVRLAARVLPIVAVVSASCALVAGLEDKQKLVESEGGLPDAPTGEDAPGVDTGVDAAPVIETVATDQNGVWGVATDDQYVYWTDDRAGTVWRRVKTLDQPAELIADNQDNPRWLAVDQSYVYWTNVYSTLRKDAGIPVYAPILVRMAKDLPQPDAQVVFSMDASGNFGHITLRPGDPWMFTISNANVRRISVTPPDDASVVQTTGSLATGAAIGTDGTYVYWYNEGNHQVWRRLKTYAANDASPPAEQIGPALDPTEVGADMAVDDAALWFGTGLGNVYRMQKVLYVDGSVPLDAAGTDGGDSGALTKIGDAGPNLRRILSLDDTIYLARWTIGGDGEILALSKSTGTAVLLASGQSQPRDIFVDTQPNKVVVYWTNGGDGSLRRIAIPK